jgi:hypothetical protein
MVAWTEFAEEAPIIAEVFVRRHSATDNLCMLATLRSDGSPRISPMEPGIFEGQLVLLGMPGTLKFADLSREPRFSLHTATIDPYVGEGDAKLWGSVDNVQDPDLHARVAQQMYDRTGMDLRGQAFDPFYVADISGASSVTFENGQLTITSWKPGKGEKAVIKN